MTSTKTPIASKLVRITCASLSLVAAASTLAAPAVVPGALLRQGEWRQDVGSFSVPQAWARLPASSWPMDGWATFVIDSVAATLTVQPLTTAEARRRLKPIVDQLVAAADASATSAPEPSMATIEMQEQERIPAYVRVPGLAWKPRTVTLYRFKNGTPQLTPALDHRFELSLNGRPFAFLLQNGLRTKDGRPYGEGTQFSLEVDGQRYDYDLGGYGWDVRIEAIGDFDGDGRPDFLFVLGGSNSGYEALVLSSQARPGRNPPTAYLESTGC
jgi:hypothetical protein